MPYVKFNPANKTCLVVLICLCMSLISCFSCARLKHDFIIPKPERILKATSDDFNKRAILLPFYNKTPYAEQNMEIAALDKVAGMLASACDNLVVIKPDNPLFPAKLATIPRLSTGEIDNFALARIGRDLGINVIVAGTIIDIRQVVGKKGVLWFTSPHHYLQTQIRIQMFDPETAAKLIDDIVISKKKIKRVAKEAQNKPDDQALMNSKLVKDVLIKSLDDLGKTISENICQLPWKGYIVDTYGGNFFISAGDQSGLKKNSILSVFDSTQVINSVGGHRFYIPGKKIGELRIEKVFSDRSEASLIKGNSIMIDDCVQLQP